MKGCEVVRYIGRVGSRGIMIILQVKECGEGLREGQDDLNLYILLRSFRLTAPEGQEDYGWIRIESFD